MDERLLLKRIAQNDEQALTRMIRQYSAYVVTVIHNRSRGILAPEDEEEITSDVFLTLWQNAGKIRTETVRPWLGAVARNLTTDRLRTQKITLPLEEDVPAGEDPLWERAIRQDRLQELQKALSRLSPENQEIFYRYYDLCQTSIEIAVEMGLKPPTVRTRLKRGREQLTHQLFSGGIDK